MLVLGTPRERYISYLISEGKKAWTDLFGLIVEEEEVVSEDEVALLPRNVHLAPLTKRTLMLNILLDEHRTRSRKGRKAKDEVGREKKERHNQQTSDVLKTIRQHHSQRPFQATTQKKKKEIEVDKKCM